MGDDNEKVKKKKGKGSKYNYNFGDGYPGVVIGHKTCNPFLGMSSFGPGSGYPGQSGVYSGQGGGYPGQSGSYAGQRGGYSGPSGGYSGKGNAYSGQGGDYGGQGGGYGGQGGGYGGQGGGFSGPGGGFSGQSGGYPGQSGGHFGRKTPTASPGVNVPAKMGWLWNAKDVPGLKPTRGWQPGGIGKSVAKLMSFKCPRGGQTKDKKKKKKKGKGQHGQDVGGGDSEPEEPLEPKPALKVQRKGDVFTIQVHPLKDLTEIASNEDPYVDCDPMVFKIIKKRSPEEQAKVEARKMSKLKKERDAEIRRALAEAAEDICKCAYMDVYCNDYSAIDRVIDNCPAFKEPECICQEESLSSLSSNATWDIEYTPPFGCFDLAPRKRKNFIHVETQYLLADTGVVETPKIKCRKSCISIKPRKVSKRSFCGPCC